MNRKWLSKILGIILIVSLMMPIHAQEQGNITVSYENMSNVTLSLYKVANQTNDGFEFVEPFQDYSVEIPNDSNGWHDLSLLLSSYIRRDEIKPIQEKKTDERGKATFHEELGLYLILVETVKDESYIYEALPVWAIVSEDNLDVQAIVKYEMHPVDSKVDVYVQKTWKDSNDTNRTKSIEVDLLQDGKLIDTVTLDASNDWRYIWKDLSSNSLWQVVETKVPKGYVVSVSKEDTSYVITNTKGSVPPNFELPNTGSGWWLIPLLLGSGMILYVFGWMLDSNHEK